MSYTDDDDKAREDAYREDKEDYPLLQIIIILLALLIGSLLSYFLFAG